MLISADDGQRRKNASITIAEYPSGRKQTDYHITTVHKGVTHTPIILCTLCAQGWHTINMITICIMITA